MTLRHWDSTRIDDDGRYWCRIPIGHLDGRPVARVIAELSAPEIAELSQAWFDFDRNGDGDYFGPSVQGYAKPTAEDLALLEQERAERARQEVADDRRALEEIKRRRPDWFQLHVVPK